MLHQFMQNFGAQGYDGGSNMVGKHNGVQQAIIERLATEALYVHYKAHCTNTALVQLHQINDDDVYVILPWELSSPTVNLALHFTKKTETCDVDFKQHLLEINDSYENKNYMTVYTDGSD